MKGAVVILGLICLFLLAGALPSPGGHQEAIFRSPVFIALMALLCAWMAACIAGRRWRRRRMLALMSHLGPLILLGGALAGFLWAREGTLVLPVSAHHQVDRVQTPEGQTVPLDFKVAAAQFSVDFHPPQYDVFGAGEEFVRRIPAEGATTLDLGKGGRVPVEDLKIVGEDGWKTFHTLPNGWTLRQAPRSARSFDARLEFTDAAGTRVLRDLRVNHPVTHGGWRFHLQSYDNRAQRYILVKARQDPGRLAVLTGIWILLAGTAWACWRRGENKEGEAHAGVG
jgi:hypothetical protein